MRKLNPNEEWALQVLRRHGSYCPGTPYGQDQGLNELRRALDGLARLKLVTIEPTDDGPRYHAA